MKSLAVFYLLIFLPLLGIIFLVRQQYCSAGVFMILLMLYALVYHPLIAGLRLLANHRITASSFGMNFIPGWQWKFFGFLFFNADSYWG